MVEPLPNGLVRFHYYHWFNGNQMSTKCRGSGSRPQPEGDMSSFLTALNEFRKTHFGLPPIEAAEPKVLLEALLMYHRLVSALPLNWAVPVVQANGYRETIVPALQLIGETPEPTDTPMEAYNKGKGDVKQKEPKYNNPYPEGTTQNAEYHRAYRENAGY